MENLEIEKLYEGFKLLRKEYVHEVSSEAYIFEHEKTGAKLLFLKNEEKERAFSITFRTPVDDNTGLPHILEHSVLCGSKNFPTKDPFATLNKSTISTFLNAFTFPDKTMYPFATTNLTEFKKIMNVYLDAVFNPNIYDQKEIFLQEGWRLNIDEKDNLTLNGVVYSEMKGALSSPDSLLEYRRYQNLFPDTQYNFNFAGDPRYIPELTYEKFLDFHKKYYHPSNSYLYLYGDLNIEEELKFINDEYLSKYEKLNIDSTLKFQDPFNEAHEKVIKYPISKDESQDNKYHFDYSFVVDKATNPEKLIAFDILSKILIGTPASPLRKALIEAKLGEDVSGSFNEEDVILQPIINIKVSNTNKDKKEKFIKIIFDTLNKIVNEGINDDLINAAINTREFELKEKIDRYPVPLVINLDVMNSWLYDSDPLTHLKYSSHLENIKKESGNRYFENLIEKYLIKNKHSLLLILEPDSNLDPEKDLKNKLRELKNTLSEEEIQKIKDENAKVKKWQENKESEEDIDRIKTLSIEEIDKFPLKVESKDIDTNIGKLLLVKDKTKGINYLNMLFDAKTIPQDKIEYLSLLGSVLYEARTTKHDYDEFSNIVNLYTGGISFGIYPFTDEKYESAPKFRLGTKFLDENIEKAGNILNYIFNDIIFEEQKVLDILNKIKSRYEASIIENGHIFAINRVKSQYCESGIFNERTSGIDYYIFIKDLLKNYENKKEEILSNLKDVYNFIFNKKNLISSYVCENENLEIFNKIKIKDIEFETYSLDLDFNNSKEAYTTSSQVNYVAKGFNFKKLGYDYTSKIQILRNFLGYGFMWEELRMKGGAYGAMSLISRDGDYIYVTYRDPHINNTLETYHKIPQYLQNLNLREEEIKKYIIGTIADLDNPLMPPEKGFKVLLEFIKGITYETLTKERQEILSVTNEDIRSFAPVIKDILEENIYCAVGNESKINENKDLFDKIVNPYK